MDHRSKLVAALLLAFSGFASAGYAYPAPPPSVSTGAGGQTLARAAANDSVVNRMIRTAAGPTVNAAGRAVTLPAAMRLAANASQYAARGLHPLIIAGVVLAPLVLDWIRDADLDVQGVQVVKKDPNVCSAEPCFGYFIVGNAAFGTYPSGGALCSAYAGTFPPNYNGSHGPYSGVYTAPNCVVRGFNNLNQPTNVAVASVSTKSVPASPVVWVPIDGEEFEQKMAPKVLPDALPKLLPFPLPVDPPIVNPSPAEIPESMPQRLPQGSPQPVPNSNPQQWRQPVVDLVPSPTTSSPWRVEVIPRDIVTTSDTAPAPLPESAPVTSPATNPATEPATTPDLCEKNPDILACQKIDLGELTPEAVKNMDRQMAINKDGGWGPANGTCPAPKTATVMGISLVMPFTLICQFADAIRPMLIGFAWLSAALTFFGLGRKD